MVFSRLFTLVLLAGLGTHCTSQPAPAPSPTLNEASITVLQDVAPLVAGRWIVDRVRVHQQPYQLYPAAFPADTILQQFAILTLDPVFYPTPDKRYPRCEGTLAYKGNSYPVYFDLRANPAYVLRQEGPPAYLSFGYRGPIALHTTTADEQLLQDIGLMNEHFSLAVVKGQPTMTWQGQTRHIKQIDFHK
jgi:hypothetical protein